MGEKERRKAESEILFELVRKRYGSRLSPEELEEVRKGVEAIAEASEALRSAKLDNSVEPSFTFRPLGKGG